MLRRFIEKMLQTMLENWMQPILLAATDVLIHQADPILTANRVTAATRLLPGVILIFFCSA